MSLSQWAAEITGLPFDWWTAFQFDRAVSYFGRDMEKKLNETVERNGKLVHVYTLEQLLAEKRPGRNDASIRRLGELIGFG